MSNTYILSRVMLFEYCVAKSIKADVVTENICSFFHPKTVESTQTGCNGINRRFSMGCEVIEANREIAVSYADLLLPAINPKAPELQFFD